MFFSSYSMMVKCKKYFFKTSQGLFYAQKRHGYNFSNQVWINMETYLRIYAMKFHFQYKRSGSKMSLMIWWFSFLVITTSSLILNHWLVRISKEKTKKRLILRPVSLQLNRMNKRLTFLFYNATPTITSSFSLTTSSTFLSSWTHFPTVTRSKFSVINDILLLPFVTLMIDS